MLPLCRDEGIGVIPWSPLARGRLTRPWDATSARSETDEYNKTIYRDEDRTIVDAVAGVAERRGISPVQVALAWMRLQAGHHRSDRRATMLAHLDDAIAAVAVQLSGEEIDRLEAPYAPHEIAGHA